MNLFEIVRAEAARYPVTVQVQKPLHASYDLRYLQEDQPHAIGRGLAEWIGRLR
jgi:hypothetical protein